MNQAPRNGAGRNNVDVAILPFPVTERQRRERWRRLVEATRDERTWQLLYIHREKLKAYIGKVVRL